MLGLGFHAEMAARGLPWMPKGRYAIMRDYMPKKGKLGLDMMLRTCTVQVNLDFAVRSRHGAEVPRRRSRCSRSPPRSSPTRRSSRASPPASCPIAAMSGPTPIPTAAACCPSCSRTASASSAMSTGCSTCRCISSIATAIISTSPASRFRDFIAGKLPGLPGEIPTIERLVGSSHHRLSRGAPEEIPRDARRRWRAVAQSLRAAGVLDRAALR